ncbi:RNA-binding protein PIN4 [Ceratobasidium sp. AG-Ba]|nr:RNA-binding protein PIN4 [Ceratobasidium sp. AG-Ba]QRW04192.1 RNA-binding protein PIN4 [Ceratobasidium sp. AG-Ba]
MSNNQQMPDISQLSLQNSSPPRSIGRFEQHANTFDGVRAAAAYHYSTSPPTQNLGVGAPGMQNATIATSPLKSKPSRAGLPSAWLEQGGIAPDERSFSPPQTSDISSGGTSPPHHHLQTPQSMNMGGLASPIDDEVIPTAIVIKNIPFTVKRETLLDIISSLSIPTPYAFNYHLDTQGQFRGLAFANFRQPADADAVVAALNGFDVQGRKLRVEYKKVLQAGEKERIEREKAIRRMRSMQLEKERTQLMPSASGGANEWDEYGAQTGGNGGAYLSPSRTYSTGQVGLSHQLQQLPPMHSPPPPQPAQMPTPTPSQQSAKSASNELDMNDPSTLEIYSRILVFKEDHMRDELAFSRSLSPKQRRVVHLVAQKLGVYHYSVGEGENRYAVVTRIERENRTPITRHASQTLSRAASSYLAPSPTAPSLRVKKSMPDMKSLHTPPSASRLQPRASNGNIREGFATISAASPRRPSVATTFGSMFGSGGMGSAGAGERGYGGVGMGVPPVPSLPSATDNGLGGSGAGQSSVMRQPRGPGAGGFARRPTGERLDARSHEPLDM